MAVMHVARTGAAILLAMASLMATSEAGIVNNEIRNSDPWNLDLAAITYLDPSIINNLQYNDPSVLSDDVPGPALTPTEFNSIPPSDPGLNLSMSDSDKNDPIELAGAFEGDIILSSPAEMQQMTQPFGGDTAARNAVIQPDRVWKNKEIPYVISSAYTEIERQTIAHGIRSFHQQTCIKFVPRASQTDYIHIYKGDGCSSSVGRTGGAQAVSLGHGCIYVGIVMHELMHAAGFWHEQSRFDRDSYIRIYWSNIKNGMEYNFQKYDWKTISHLDTGYDLASIMHYGPKSFARDSSKKTIEALNGAEIGQRRGFSKMDETKLNKLYKCDETGPNKVTEESSTTGSTGGIGQCRDTHDADKCSAWASTGECSKNPAWMLINCQKSCNNCKELCTNNHENCEYWAKKGECTKNTAYMHLYCKKSCGLCHALSDVSNECIDQNEYCGDWAASGTCHTNTDYMVTFCKKSCTECSP